MVAMRPTLPLLLLATALAAASCASEPQATPGTTGTPGRPGTSAPVTSGEPLPSADAPTDPPTGTAEPTETSGPGTSEGPGPTDAPVGFAPRSFRLTLEEIATGLDQPVFLTHAGDGSGQLYIVERPGRIRVLESDGSLRQGSFLDIRDRVDTENERGFHAVAFDPGFASNGRFYVHYNDRSGDTIVAEYRADGDGNVDADAERRILRVDQPYANHNGGWLAFGHDGNLYLALGDGGGDSPGDPFRNGQDRSVLLGKILRFDVSGEGPYRIPADNPFADGGDGRAPEIWHLGLRNPWRASFDRETGDLWIGDVGQDTFEEINVAPAGEGGLNFGWSDTEGDRCHLKADCDPSRYVLPVTTYGTDQEGCAVSGGYVYRGTEWPALVGGYLYSDFCSGTIWGFDAAKTLESGSADVRKLLGTDLNIVSFGEDEAGELYAVDLGGTVHRVTAPPRP
jgi:glucose/arabinose dehydrogenase